MRGSRVSAVVRLLAVAAAASLGVAGMAALDARPPAGHAPQDPRQRPVFRAAANFVQVDVYPTAGGRPVADLSKADFEVFEDGAPQAVSTFEHVAIQPAGPTVPRIEPRTIEEANELAADPRHRLFVIFLDTYHVTDPGTWHDGLVRMAGSTTGPRQVEKRPVGPRPIDKALLAFLERAIGRDDLVAAMSPEMDPSSLVFGRRPERFEEWLATAWGRRFAWDDLEPEEERWAVCYPPDDVGDPFGCYRGILEEMVLRRREQLTLRALSATVDRLGQLRDGRKAVLLVSEGWRMYRENQSLARALPPMSMQGCPQAAPTLPGIYVGPGGRIQTGTDPRSGSVVDHSACDAARLRLALIDDDVEYRRLLDRANRQTVSFYPVDPRGLAAIDTPPDANPPGPPGQQPPRPTITTDQGQLVARLETLHNLATATDGSMTETNDLEAGLRKIADDLSDYYLLGYNSTNAAPDGRFRKISVRVKRPGVTVRARRGYLAPTEAEIAAGLAPPPDAGVRIREAALAALDAPRPDRAVNVSAGYEWAAEAGKEGLVPAIWAVVELAGPAARKPEWDEGGQVTLTVADSDGRAVASAKGPVSRSQRVFEWASPAGAIGKGAYTIRATVKPGSGLEDPAQQVRVDVPARAAGTDVLPGTVRLYRRGPATGLTYMPTSDARFSHVERLRAVTALGTSPAPVVARLLDRRGRALGVPVAAAVEAERGVHLAVADATLGPLAPGDYLLEISIGEGAARQVVMTAIRIVP